MELFDVAIIGSGPAGLTAAIYTARAGLKTVVFAGTKWGGQLMQTSVVENFPGFPDGIDGPVLMENMKKQAEKFGAKIIFENVISIQLTANRYLLTAAGASAEARAVILATGAETKWLGLPNEQRLIGHGVSSCATCDGFFFKGKKVAVVGGGDAALEEALFLTKFASEVTIIHRRDSFRASQIMQDRVKKHPKIKILWNTQIVDVLGKEKVESLKIKTLISNLKFQISNLSADGVFIAIGHRPNTELLSSLAPGFPDHPDLPAGLFVAGEVVERKYKQIITSAASGCQAALDAQKWLEANNPWNLTIPRICDTLKLVISRIYDHLEKELRPGKVIVLYGPRRVGKTTVVKNLLAKTKLKYKFDSGDDLSVQEILSSQRFNLILPYLHEVELYVVDEAQHIPNIGMGLKIIVDQIPNIRDRKSVV